MKYKELQHVARAFLPILSLEEFFPRYIRERTAKILDITAWVFIFLAAIFLIALKIPTAFPQFSYVYALAGFQAQIYGVLLIILSLRVSLFLVEAFYNSFYFRGLEALLRGDGISRKFPCISAEASSVIYAGHPDGITVGFVNSRLGNAILLRSGISEGEIKTFINSRKETLKGDNFMLTPNRCITLSVFARELLKNDKEFSKFLFSKKIGEGDFMGVAEWVERQERITRRKERWWSRERLAQIPGIGREWSYGSVYLLKRYGRDIESDPVFSSLDALAHFHNEEVSLLETILARSRDANAVIVGEEGVGKLEIIARLAKRTYGESDVRATRHKRIYILNSNMLIASQKEKASFEEEFIKICRQVAKAGNTIMVLENFPSFIISARALGSDVASILTPILSSSSLQVIATSNLRDFHEHIESNPALMRYFEKMFAKTTRDEALTRMLEDTAIRLEEKENVFVTYPAIKEVALGTARYFPSSILQEKAVDILIESISSVKKKNTNGVAVVRPEDILQLIEQKTGIPTGDVKGEEKEKLLNLEKILRERIVGQDEAVSAISNTMRRARAGVQNPNRPIGSFLFLGPTGVGKTETTKALADVFFGGEKEILRLDMSEYSSSDALERLIGSFTSNKVGTLVSMLREKPYGVLLLDEFEKTTKEVHNLFLRILDEGMFSDMRGKKVNAKNTIIIATSNAASKHIWELFKNGKDVSVMKDELVGRIVKEEIFKPELLNRFDGIIVFHPLGEEHIRRIARLLLEKLRSRLKEQGVELVINDVLIEELVRKGHNPEFGARPMRRVIQENVEQVIAEKKIRGEIQPGVRVAITKDDLQK